MSYNRSPPRQRQPTRRSYTRDRSSDYISRSSRPDGQYDYISGSSRTSGRRHAARPRRSHRHRDRDEDEDEDGDYIAPPRPRRSPSRADYIDPRPHRPSRKSHSRVDSGFSRPVDEPVYAEKCHDRGREARYARYADEDEAAHDHAARRTRDRTPEQDDSDVEDTQHRVEDEPYRSARRTRDRTPERDDSDVEDTPYSYTRHRSPSYTPAQRPYAPAHDSDSASASDSDIAPVPSPSPSPRRHHHHRRRRRQPSPSPAPIDSDIASDPNASSASDNENEHDTDIVPPHHDPLAFNTRRTRRYRASDVSVREHDVRVRARGDASPRRKAGGGGGDAGEMRRRYEAYVEDGTDVEGEGEGHGGAEDVCEQRRLGDGIVATLPRDGDGGSDSDVVAFRGREGAGKIGAWVSEGEEDGDGGAWMSGSDVESVRRGKKREKGWGWKW